MSKYTKGPWKVVGGTGLCISSDNGKDFIGSASIHSENHYEEAKANANLIAAAPDMLDALEQLVSIVKIHSNATDSNFAWAELEESYKAIAKAKGEL